MEPIGMITDKQELEGTGYIELLPGVFTGKVWSSNSVYFSEESFGYMEPVFEEVVAEFNRYAFTEVPAELLPELSAKLHKLADFLAKVKSTEELNGRIGFIYAETEAIFALDFSSNRQALVDMIEELCDWLDKQADEQDAITILGL